MDEETIRYHTEYMADWLAPILIPHLFDSPRQWPVGVKAMLLVGPTWHIGEKRPDGWYTADGQKVTIKR